MNTYKEIYMLTTRFSAYHGLKGIPVGLLLLVISLWANAQSGPSPSLFFPLSICILFAYLYWIVNRFYDRVFGVVIPEQRQKRIVCIYGAVSGIGALITFWVDVSLSPTFSVLCLFFSCLMLSDYLRLARQRGERLLYLYPAVALLMAVVSLLPLLGIEWWTLLGFKVPVLAVCAVFGLLISILGLIVHISFENLLLHVKETDGE